MILMRIMPPVPSSWAWAGNGRHRAHGCFAAVSTATPCVASRELPRAWRRAVPMRSVSGTRLPFRANLLRFPAIRSFRSHSRGEAKGYDGPRSGWEETPRPRGQTRGLTSAHWQGGWVGRPSRSQLDRRDACSVARTPQRCPLSASRAAGLGRPGTNAQPFRIGQRARAAGRNLPVAIQRQTT